MNMVSKIKNTVSTIRDFISGGDTVVESTTISTVESTEERVYGIADIVAAIDNAIEVTQSVRGFTLSSSVIFELEKAKQFTNVR